MSVAAAPDPLLVYRDEGPIAQAVGRAAGRRVPLPAFALVVLAALPMAVAIVAGRDEASDAVAVATVAWLVLVGSLAAGRRDRQLIWGTPPALRLAEYGALLWLAALAGDGALPAAFALLCAIAYRQYDLVYRLRFQRRTPPAIINTLSGGWEGRLLLAAALLLADAVTTGYFVAAAALAALVVGESVASWRQLHLQGGLHDDEDDYEGTLD